MAEVASPPLTGRIPVQVGHPIEWDELWRLAKQGLIDYQRVHGGTYSMVKRFRLVVEGEGYVSFIFEFERCGDG